MPFRLRTPIPLALLVAALAASVPAAAGDLLTMASPPGGTFGRGIDVALANPEGGTIYFTLDGSEPNTDSDIYRGPVFLRSDTVLKFFAVDAQGRREPVREAAYVFTLTDRLLDTTPPEAASDRASGRFGKGEKVRLSANEEAEIRFTTDGTDPTDKSPLYKDPIELPAGTTVIRFLAIDPAGNRSRIGEETFRVDTNLPVTASYPEGGLYRPPLGVKLVSSKANAVIRYTTDGSEPNGRSPVYTEPLSLSRDTRLRFFSVDDVGNVETAKSVEYRLDGEAPRTVASPAPGSYPPPFSVSLTTDPGARIHYTLDKGVPDETSPLYSDPIPVTRPITLRFFALDQVGNREEPQTAEYSIKNGVWRTFVRGVFMIPSVTDGTIFWMRNEEGPGVVRYKVGSGSRQVVAEKEGLRGKTVHDLLLDQSGVLWVATDQGAFRLQGERFTSFTRDEGMPDREVLSLAVDLDGSVWAGTRSGAARLSGDRVERVLTTRDGLPDPAVFSITVDASGAKWFGTARGLARWDGKAWTTWNASSGLAGNEVRAVQMDAAWNLWAGGPSGLARFDGKGWKTFTKADGLPGNSILLLTTEQGGDVWVATTDGVARWSGGKFIPEARP